MRSSWSAAPELIPPRQRTPVATIFDQTFRIYWQSLLPMALAYAAFAIPAVMVLLPASLFQASVSGVGFYRPGMFGATYESREIANDVFIGGLLYLVCGAVAIALVILALASVASIALRADEARKQRLMDGFRGLVPSTRPLAGLIAAAVVAWSAVCAAGTAIGIALVVSAGPVVSLGEVTWMLVIFSLLSLLVFVIGAFVVARLSLAIPALVAEALAPMAAFRRSWHLSEGSTLRIIGLLVLGGVLVGFLAGVTTWILLPRYMESALTGSVTGVLELTAVSTLWSVALGPLIPTLLVVVYRDLTRH